MTPQKQQMQDSSPKQSPQTRNNGGKVAKRSRLSFIGLIFAVIVPPIGLILSIVALSQIRSSHLRGKSMAIFGIIWGAIFTLPFAFTLWLFIALGGWGGNDAKKNFQPFIAKMQVAGGKEICDNGDGGFGFDNTQPWYEAYYELPNSPQLTNEIKSDASQFGFPLSENTQLINQLKGIPDNNGDVTDPYGGATFNSKSDYLISHENGDTLTVTINRSTSVPLYCGVGSYGSKKSTGNDSAIVDVYFTLPDRNQ